MRLNKFLASATGMSRRAADGAIQAGRVRVNGAPAQLGQVLADRDVVMLDNQPLATTDSIATIMLNKPPGYVVSRNGQGSKTIYNLLPPRYQHLKPIGRLDKDSSGLLLLTNDGQLANELTHPSKQKTKVYEVELDKPLAPLHQQMITDYGVLLDDGPSKLRLESLSVQSRKKWRVIMHEGRNRQIRRTFASLGYKVTSLHRTQFGPYSLDDIASGIFERVMVSDGSYVQALRNELK